MTLQYVPDSDEDVRHLAVRSLLHSLFLCSDSDVLQDQPKKKARVSSKGRSLVDFLPPPKQDLSSVPLGKGGSKVRCPVLYIALSVCVHAAHYIWLFCAHAQQLGHDPNV